MLASLYLFSKPYEVKEYIFPDCSRVSTGIGFFGHSFWVSVIPESITVVRRMQQPEWPAWVLLQPLYGAVGELRPDTLRRVRGSPSSRKEGPLTKEGEGWTVSQLKVTPPQYELLTENRFILSVQGPTPQI